MKHLFLAIFVVFSANLFTGCTENDGSTVPEVGELSAEFKLFMHKEKSGFPPVKDPRFGFIPAPLDNSTLLKQFIVSSGKINVKTAADPAYDLRDYDRVTSVKDQGGCGSCWSFAAMASLESNFMPVETNDFSENNLKNLHGFDRGHCSGGNSDMAAAYFMRWNGPVNENSDPYNATSDVSPTLDPVKHVTDHYVVSSGDIFSIKEALVERGVVTANMYYDDAYLNTTTGGYYYSGLNTVNHGVAIVGWDDSYSKSNFLSAPANDGAWIIKNSWGDTWGTSWAGTWNGDGYFYISYENSGINDDCHAFKVTAIEYENLYSHDPFGRTGWAEYESETAWMSNIFTAGSDETLKAVSFYANSHSTAYEIRIYSGVTTDPTSGATLETTQTGTAFISGYNSVVLDTPVDLSSGTKFSVVVKVTTPGNTNPIPLEMPYPGYANATASTGESFMSSDSGGNPAGWTDVAGWNANTNVNVKAYSVAQAVPVELVINEIDYDQDSIDTAEFIEIYNKGSSSVNLAGVSLQLITGSDNSTYGTINLPDVDLAAGDYYVVCGTTANVPNCDLDVTPDTNLIQNGSPDAVALYNGAELLDTVSYEGDTVGYTETAGAATDDPNNASSGLSRYPNGQDTDDNSSDFSVRCVTPGAANSSSTMGCLCGNGNLDAGEDCEVGDGPCCSDICEYEVVDVICRAAEGDCDSAEYCSGDSVSCPTDDVEPDTTECRASAGDCDAADYCDGSTKDCPTDAKLTTECRASEGLCDVAEVCDGVSNDCPADAKLTTECRASTGVCDVAEICDGTGNDCPTDGVAGASVECRGSAGFCDEAEYCNGTNKTCPADVKKTVECRAATGNCDVAEVCNGVSNDCPADGVEPDTTECREPAGMCDKAEYCDGTTKICPADIKLTSECRASTGICDVAENCDGAGNDCPADGVAGTDEECRGSNGVCDVAEFCNGTNKTCPADVKKTTECRSATGICDVAEICDGVENDCPVDGVAGTDVECRGSNGTCDVAENCDGTGKDCPIDAKLTTECRASEGVCDAAEVCDGVGNDCPADTKLTTECRASTGVCDVTEVCDGVENDCPVDEVAGTDVECRGSNGTCDVAEFCNGANKTCPADEFAGSEIECRASAGECDTAETCSGLNADCPADNFVADGEVCVGDGYPWTEYECLSGICEAGDELYGSCLAPNEISSFPYSDTQDTTGRSDHISIYGSGCDAIKSSSSDVAYELNVRTGYKYTVTVNSTEDMAAVVLNACGDNEACVEAADENETGEESLEIVPETDTVYALIVETVGSTGEYTLTVTETEVEVPDEDAGIEDTDVVDDMDLVDNDADVDDLSDEVADAESDAEVVDEMENNDDAQVDDISDESEVSDQSEVSDEVSDNSDTTTLNDEDEPYNKSSDGCSCSLIF